MRYRKDQKRVAIGRQSYGLSNTESATASRSIVDKKWLAESFRKPLSEQSSVYIICRPRGESNDNAHRASRIGLGSCDSREARKCDRTCGQMQELSTGKLHDLPLPATKGMPISMRKKGVRLPELAPLYGPAAHCRPKVTIWR
jgi:hypothetical protein